tara:strand:+ start:917 stop:1201 length:285 start_codon:yes stop_codon:yes gene_type:complete
MNEQIEHVMCIAKQKDFKKLHHFSIDLALMQEEGRIFSCYDTDALDAVKAKARTLPYINSDELEVVSVIWAQRLKGTRLDVRLRYHAVQVISYP